MADMDDELITHVAAGTDVWTALAASEDDDKPPQGKGCLGAVLVIVVAEQPGIWGVILAGTSVLSFNRMRWFSECYTRELVLEFIRACETSAVKEAPAGEGIRREKLAQHPIAAIKVLPSFQGFPL